MIRRTTWWVMIRNLGIVGGSVTGASAMLAGSWDDNSGHNTCLLCNGKCDVEAGFTIGGLSWDRISGTIIACYATGDATGTGNNVAGNNVGGLVGTVVVVAQ